MYVVMLLFGTVLLVGILILTWYLRKYSKIDRQYGKPYKARLVKLTGTHPQLRSGICSLVFHPNGAISLNQRVFTYSEIKTIEIVERVEKGEHSRIVLLVQDDYGENKIFLTSKTEFIDIANELQKAWLKSKIC